MAKYLDSAGLTRVWGKISSLFARKSEVLWEGDSTKQNAKLKNRGLVVHQDGEVAVGRNNVSHDSADGGYTIFSVGFGEDIGNDAMNAFEIVRSATAWPWESHVFIKGIGGYTGEDGEFLGTKSPVDRILRRLYNWEIDSIILVGNDDAEMSDPDEDWQ